MSAAFDRALAKTLAYEGGLEVNPLDPGGRTNRGITQQTYDAWRVTHGLGRQDVALLSGDEERAIYFENYWTPCRCEELPDPLGAAVFDMAVNSGPWNAKVTLQRAVRVQVDDGVIGPATIAAAATTPDALLAFLKERAIVYVEAITEHPSSVAFLHGWINRLLDQAYTKDP